LRFLIKASAGHTAIVVCGRWKLQTEGHLLAGAYHDLWCMRSFPFDSLRVRSDKDGNDD